MRQSGIIIGLVVSLVINVFLIGGVVGAIVIGAGLVKAAQGARGGPYIVASQGVPQPDRAKLRQVLAGIAADNRAQASQSLILRTSAWGALADAKPDPAAIEQKLAQSRQIDIALRAASEQKVVAYLATLPPQDRTAFAAGMIRAITPPPQRERRLLKATQ